MTTIEKKGNGGYAWIIVALCFLMTFTCLGFGSSTNQLFVKSVSEHLQVSRGAYSVIQTLRHVINCVISFFFGFFVLKLGAKRLICAGFVCLSGAFAIFSFAENIWLLVTGEENEPRILIFMEADDRALSILKSNAPFAFTKKI